MADQWYAIVDIATGELYSTATIIAPLADLLDKGREAIALAFDPQDGTWEWDKITRQFKTRIVITKTSLDLAIEAVEKLSLAEKSQLKAML